MIGFFMLLLRAVPLSFAIFWRFILVLPLWTIFYAVLVAFFMWAVLASISLGMVGLVVLFPLLSLAGIAVSYIIAVHPYLVATRIGLRARGIQTDYSDKRIFGAAVGYGVFEAVVGSMIAFGFAAVVALATGGADALATLNPPQVTDPMATIASQAMRASPDLLILVIAAVVMALRAALLPVLAQAAAGRSPEGHPHAPLAGFGQNFVPLMVLLAAIALFSIGFRAFLGNAVSVLGLVGLLTDGLRDSIELLMGQRLFAFDKADTLTLVGVILLSIWLFSLQCAGAVVSFECSMTQTAAKKKAVAAATRQETADIGDLLRARMPKRQG